MLTSVATKGRAPYKTVLTHGFVVDESGRKMSKSVGNVVDPDEVIKQYGADVLRLWVASVNYTDDIPIGKNLLAQLADVYRKLRNTARYMLGNVHDFDPATDSVPYGELPKLDRFILHRLNEVIDEIRTDFDNYDFFKYYQVLQNFCGVELSAFYFDICKDRLYTTGKKSQTRRAVQTTLTELLGALVRLLVPVTPHLAEDIWQHVPDALRKTIATEESALLTDFPAPNPKHNDEKLSEFYNSLLEVRSTANKALEQARAEKKIGSPLEAQVVLSIDNDELKEKVASLGHDLPGFFITSQATVAASKNGGGDGGADGDKLSEVSENGITVSVLKASGTKCARCWKFMSTVGNDPRCPDICTDCVEAVMESGEGGCCS